jgi:hypothetical protein
LGAFYEPLTPYLVSHAPAMTPGSKETICRTTTPRRF